LVSVSKHRHMGFLWAGFFLGLALVSTDTWGFYEQGFLWLVSVVRVTWLWKLVSNNWSPWTTYRMLQSVVSTRYHTGLWQTDRQHCLYISHSLAGWVFIWFNRNCWLITGTVTTPSCCYRKCVESLRHWMSCWFRRHFPAEWWNVPQWGGGWFWPWNWRIQTVGVRYLLFSCFWLTMSLHKCV